MLQTAKEFRLVLKVGLLAAFLATFISAFLFTILSAVRPIVGSLSPSGWDITKSTFLLLPITLVSCGSYGLAAGIVGGAFLIRRTPHTRSTGRLMIESAVAGLVLGFGFPFFDHLLSQYGTGWDVILAPATGMLCAIICALSFRGGVVRMNSSEQSSS
jgi:hypothetical protein